MSVESLFGQAETRAPRSFPRLRSAERWGMQRLFAVLGNPPLRLELWNGESISGGTAPVATIRLRSRRVLLGLLLNPQLSFGEAYTHGGLEIEGDLGRVLELLFEAPDCRSRLWDDFVRWRQNLLSRHSLRRARRDIRSHYDLGNDFYALWLDRQMSYTCAYFPTAQATLEEAQLAKFDHICRKLQLRPGERVVEAGCGWGSLALYMARHYGVSVTAYNISREQIQHARERARREGLAEQVEFKADDYRKIRGRYDAFVSVGMLEHVGRSQYRELGSLIAGCLSSRGRGLLHSIGRSRPRAMNAWIERRIFPGAYIPSLREMLLVLEPHGLCMLDVEDLRPHYARTLEHWLHRFEKYAAAIERRFDAAFVRTWRLYLASSIAAFHCGSVQLFQILFSRPGYEAAWTRAHLYTAPPPGDGGKQPWTAATS
jgi:cyclopropane-fatty-acyl-phospholipid synthase